MISPFRPPNPAFSVDLIARFRTASTECFRGLETPHTTSLKRAVSGRLPPYMRASPGVFSRCRQTARMSRSATAKNGTQPPGSTNIIHIRAPLYPVDSLWMFQFPGQRGRGSCFQRRYFLIDAGDQRHTIPSADYVVAQEYRATSLFGYSSANSTNLTSYGRGPGSERSCCSLIRYR